MRKLTLTNHVQYNTTVLENEFIDRHMAKANGEYVKVYLLLLRHMSVNSVPLSVSEIADFLECTEKDVIRALNYWKKEGLLEYESLGETSASIPSVLPSDKPKVVPPSPESLTAEVQDIQKYRSRKARHCLPQILMQLHIFMNLCICLPI